VPLQALRRGASSRGPLGYLESIEFKQTKKRQRRKGEFSIIEGFKDALQLVLGRTTRAAILKRLHGGGRRLPVVASSE